MTGTFSYNPNPTLGPAPVPPAPPNPPPAADYGLLSGLEGTWVGKGFNAIWRPNQISSGQDRVLELNLTRETLSFQKIGGPIPNRGLLQQDLFMAGLSYLQQISDANLEPPEDGLHFEPGVWLNIPATSNPPVSTTVARLASIPHGVTLLLQGLASQAAGPPVIPGINLDPFSIGNPATASPFPEQNLATNTKFRIAGPGIDQDMVNNPNSVLQGALPSSGISSTITLQVTTGDAPTPGGGDVETAFLQGTPSAGPNSNVAGVTATFWLETIAGPPEALQLQYSQTVLLNFNNLTWPHVTVATLQLGAD